MVKSKNVEEEKTWMTSVMKLFSKEYVLVTSIQYKPINENTI